MDKTSIELNGIIAKMLEPLKGISFSAVIKGIAGFDVIPFDKNNQEDKELLNILIEVAENTTKEVNRDGIIKARPNEVGNEIENYVKESLEKYKLSPKTPICQSGRKKTTGYPDLEINFNKKTVYIECKTYNKENIDTSFRTFYLSPSDDFKVTSDAHHLVISFEVKNISQMKETKYICKNWMILDITELKLDLKNEFNSNNKRLYDKNLILAQSNKQ